MKKVKRNPETCAHRLISIQMPVYMLSLMNAGQHTYTITLCVCVHIQESSSLVDSYLTRTYLLSKRRYCRVERTTEELDSEVLHT